MKKLLFISLAALIAVTPAASKTAAPAKPATAAPAELKWMDGPPGLPAGAQFAVLKGNPGAKGPFTIHIKMPPAYAVPAHHHPTDEKVTLVSGRLAYGMSDRLNRAAAAGLAVGETIVMKAKMNHWVLTADGAEVEVSAMGPFAITYANPAEDPRNAGRAERGQ